MTKPTATNYVLHKKDVRNNTLYGEVQTEVQAEVLSAIELNDRFMTKHIHVDPAFTTIGPLKENNLEIAITKANTLALTSTHVYIRLASGNYIFTSPQTISANVSLVVNEYGSQATFLLFAPLANPWFTLGGNNFFRGIRLFGNNLCSVVLSKFNGGLNMEGVVIAGADVLLDCGGPSNSLVLDGCGFSSINTVPLFGLTNFTTIAVRNTGPSDFIFYNSVFTTELFELEPLAGPPFTLLDTVGGRHVLDVVRCAQLGDVIVATGGADVTVIACDFTENTNDVIIGGSSTLALSATTFANTVEYTVDVLDADTVVRISGIVCEVNKLRYINLANFSATFTAQETNTGKGFYVYNTLVSGDKIFPSNTWLGNGYFNIEGTVVLRNSIDNIKPDLLQDNVTPVNLFTSTTAGEYLYIGDDVKFSTFQFNVTQLSIGAFIIEAWDGVNWTSVNFMTTDVESPYGSIENDLFSLAIALETRLDVRLAATWMQTTVNSLTKYWIRISSTIILSAIPQATTATIIYNSSRFTADGVLMRYGNARVYKTIDYDMNLIETVQGAATTGQDIYFGENSALGRSRNSMGKNDKLTLCYFVPNDADSSSPFRISIAYVSSNVAASQTAFNLTLTTGNVEEGDRVYFTGGAASGIQVRDEATATTDFFPNQTVGTFVVFRELIVPLPNIRSRTIDGSLKELFTAEIRRNNDGNNNDMVFIQITIQYLSWIDGLSI